MCITTTHDTFFREPGVVLVNPEEPFLKVNDEPCGWEFFSKRGWKVVPVPHPVVCKGRLYESIYLFT